MVTSYNKISEEYGQFLSTCLRSEVHDYNFNKIIQELILKGRLNPSKNFALDLACGEGRYTRKLKRLGFEKAVGIDLSFEMIDSAKKQESQEKLDIEYFTSDISNIDKLDIGKFDVVTAWFLLHYATSKDHLNKMLMEISNRMRSGAIFVTYQSNPLGPQTRNLKKYGEIKKVIGAEVEGADVMVTLLKDGGEISFVRKLWSQKTYEKAFADAGLKIEQWTEAEVSPKSIAKMGNDFWKEYQDEPSHILVIASKK